METLRPKNESKEFFERLHAFSLYDQLEKRDGSIVTVIKDERGELITNPSDIDTRLINILEELHGILQGEPGQATLTESHKRGPVGY